MIRPTLLAAVCLASAYAATPRLTTIQDVLYKADGTRFNGILTISWDSFQSADNATIVTQSSTVKVVDGNLRVQLVPTANITPPSYYTVTYNSDGRVQFQETWLVTAATQPVRVRDVRTAEASTSNDTAGASGGVSGPVAESDVVGLVADLGARPLKGAAMAAGRVAFINSLGAIDSVTGNAADCLHVDGSSGACGGAGGGVGGSATFVDGDSPAGIVDGANTTFALSAAPNPASSLAVYRNGMLQKAGQDFTASGSTLHFVAAAAPQPGDTLLASYRLAAGAPAYAGALVVCGGTGSSTASVTLAGLGTCAIPAGVLAAGDRVEIHFDLAHAGTASGFTFEVDWGATTLLHRDAAADDALVTGRAEAGLVAGGAQLSAQTWGTLLPWGVSVAASADAYASGVTLLFQGKLAQSGDTLTLANYTVVRLP